MKGFSLVELSIVLVILGLLTGGILSGQSLIRAAELRSVQTEIDKFQISVNIFKEKYNSLPGDLDNATSFWGAANADPATCQTTASTGTETCNGNNDGKISLLAAGLNGTETYRAWQHLQNAGLIKGKYTGIQGSGGRFHHQVGINVPEAAIHKTGYSLVSHDVPTSTSWFPFTNKTYIMYGRESTTSDPYVHALTTVEAYSIDKKLDDGRPGTGRIQSLRPPYSSCPTSNDPTTALYNIGSEDIVCVFVLFIE